MDKNYIDSDTLRSYFSNALSEMYTKELPVYSALQKLVKQVNANIPVAIVAPALSVDIYDDVTRFSEVHHGAIRLGSTSELSLIRRFFAVLGMYPVGYYDLSVAGIPVHSTAFRPLKEEALKHTPFRMFTSLLRVELIEDEAVRVAAEKLLQERRIVTDKGIALLERAEQQGGLSSEDAPFFIEELISAFCWHEDACVSKALYYKLQQEHPLIADVVAFKGPHINHLTPRTLAIDHVQQRISDIGISPKAVIEGPPARQCPILLRQTSFKALSESVQFVDGTEKEEGLHTARFGEVEERGVALTRAGRQLYDTLLNEVHNIIVPDASNVTKYMNTLATVFKDFPDDWGILWEDELAYFRIKIEDQEQLTQLIEKSAGLTKKKILQKGVEQGCLLLSPIIYEDFLPVSAAGIFQSNLVEHTKNTETLRASQAFFVVALGCPVINDFDYYAKIQEASYAQVFS